MKMKEFWPRKGRTPCHAHSPATHAPCHAHPPPCMPPCHTCPHACPLPRTPPCHSHPPAMHAPTTRAPCPCEQNHRRLWKRNLAATTLRTENISLVIFFCYSVFKNTGEPTEQERIHKHKSRTRVHWFYFRSRHTPSGGDKLHRLNSFIPQGKKAANDVANCTF